MARNKLGALIAALPPCVVAMEACSGAHHWARQLHRHGHTVKLMAPKLVAPYRLSGKQGQPRAHHQGRRRVSAQPARAGRQGGTQRGRAQDRFTRPLGDPVTRAQGLLEGGGRHRGEDSFWGNAFDGPRKCCVRAGTIGLSVHVRCTYCIDEPRALSFAEGCNILRSGSLPSVIRRPVVFE